MQSWSNQKKAKQWIREDTSYLQGSGSQLIPSLMSLLIRTAQQHQQLDGKHLVLLSASLGTKETQNTTIRIAETKSPEKIVGKVSEVSNKLLTQIRFDHTILWKAVSSIRNSTSRKINKEVILLKDKRSFRIHTSKRWDSCLVKMWKHLGMGRKVVVPPFDAM